MRAVIIRDHGDVDALRFEEVDSPSPRDGHAIVSVRAVALNHLDLWVRRGVPGHRFPLPMVPGSEVSGVIEWLPDGCPGWSLGDEVVVAPGRSCGVCLECSGGRDPLCREYGIYGESFDGGCRDRVVVPLRNLLPKPRALSFAEAAAIPLDFLTAWHMLVDRARISQGETVLVQAGGSGVGSAALQIARLWNARTIATVGSEEKAKRAQGLADHVINYRENDFSKVVREITEKRGVDIIVEHVGADTWERSIRSLARGGRLVTCGATTGADVGINLRVVFFKAISILGSTMGSLHELHEILSHVDAGRLVPVVDRVLPVEQIAEGHRILEERRAFGKVVLEL